jgi:hypothetical protein
VESGGFETYGITALSYVRAVLCVVSEEWGWDKRTGKVALSTLSEEL